MKYKRVPAVIAPIGTLLAFFQFSRLRQQTTLMFVRHTFAMRALVGSLGIP